MVRASSILTVFLLAAGAVRAQSSPPADQAREVRMLLERVQQLEKRVTELEARQASPQAATISAANEPSTQQLPAHQAAQAPAAAGPGPGQHQHETQEQQAATVQQMETHYPSLQIRITRRSGIGIRRFTTERGCRLPSAARIWSASAERLSRCTSWGSSRKATFLRAARA